MTYFRSKSAFIALFVALAAVSCGDDSSTGTPGGAGGVGGGGGSGGAGGDGGGSTADPSATIATFCGDIAAPFCDALFACCTDPQVLGFYGGNLEDCKAGFATACASPDDIGGRIKDQLEKKATALDEARLAACVATLSSMKGGGAACVRPPQWVYLIDCVSAFRGTAPLGGVCDAPGDIGFVGCDKANCVDDVCVPFLAEGEACDPANYQEGACDFLNGQGCVGPEGMTKCGPQAPVGADCPLPGGDKTFSCHSMSCGADGKCSAPSAFGICSGG